MMQSASESVDALLALFSADKRLYELTLHPAADFASGAQADASRAPGAASLLVEGFTATDTLHGIPQRDLLVLSTNAHLDLKRLIGCRATLHISLADGTRKRFAGLLNAAALLGSEGGLARYRIRLVPWLWLLSQRRASRLWQNQSIADIVDSVFAHYAPHAAWQWTSDARTALAEVPPRSVVAMFRETDLAFVSRLLAEEGMSWRIDDTDDYPGSHQVVLFAHSAAPTAFAEDATSAHPLGGAGIRFHGAHAREEQDSIQSLTATRTLQAALTTVLSADYKTKRASTASIPTHHAYGGEHAPRLESYDTPGLAAWADAGEAARYARLQQEAVEARNKQWRARSTVRTLRAGTRFDLTQGPLQGMSDLPSSFAVLEVTSVGINNLPKPARESIAHLLGPVPELLAGQLDALAQGRHAELATGPGTPCSANHALGHQHAAERAAVLAQAQATGYANAFTAIRSDIVWRPVLADGTGRLLHPKPTAPGSQSAIVVGLDGTASTNQGEVCCDRLGRVRIRFHWQGRFDDSISQAHASCWVRVAQRATGPGMGWRFLPRIGQEVIVQFIEGDIDCPVIVGALYNGQGEGGTPPTPGGKTARPAGGAQAQLFAAAHDHAASAQANLTGGNAPVWHGASADTPGHRNAAAQWGIRSKEWGGTGYNQLLFDDSDAQGRVQCKTTQAATELNMGHLIHAADNYRGSFRGTGIELRTDAHGALRAGSGLLLSTYASRRSSTQREPVGDNAPALAHLKQATTLAASFSQAATTHKTVAYASHAGVNKPNASAIDDTAAPLEALRRALSGMVSAESFEAAQADAAAKETAPQAGRVPHSSAPVIGIAAKAGLGMIAGQDIQLANGETIVVASGNDAQLSSGAAQRLYSGQAIGVLAGSVAAGEQGIGLQLIAAQEAITLQAQAGTMRLQAKEEVTLHSVKAHIDWAAAKKITLSTAGGAAIVIEGGNITVQCPGKITVHAGQKSFTGPTRLDYPLPLLPKQACVECLLSAQKTGSAFATK